MSLKIAVDVNLAQFSFNIMTEQNAQMQYQGISKKAHGKILVTGFTQPQAEYSIDDMPVSQSEFQLFINSFTIPGMITDEDPTAPDTKAPTQCSFAVYEKNKISSEVLKNQLQISQLQKEGLLAQGQSCMKDLSVPFKKDTNAYAGDLKFGTKWISFTSQAPSSEKLSGGVYVLYGDPAVQTNESEELIMGLKCQAAPTCL